MPEKIIIDENEIETLTLGLVEEPALSEEEIEELETDEGNNKPGSKNYVDKAELTAALREWKKQCEEAEAKGLPRPGPSNYIGKAILDIANGASSKFNWRNYSFREDMVAEASYNVLKYLHNFNPDAYTVSGVPNPFWYISRQCNNVFKKFVESEARQQYYKYKAFTMLPLGDLANDEDFSSEHMGSGSADHTFQDMSNDINAKVSQYEEKQRLKRIKNAEALKAAAEAKPPQKGKLSEFFV